VIARFIKAREVTPPGPFALRGCEIMVDVELPCL
jgi:hypothetical protein